MFPKERGCLRTEAKGTGWGEAEDDVSLARRAKLVGMCE